MNISFVNLAESAIDGSLYSGISNSSSQPRVGAEQCTACQSGTWPDVYGQRLVVVLIENDSFFFVIRCTPCANVTPRLSAPTGNTTITCCTANTIFVRFLVNIIFMKSIFFLLH